MRGEIPFIKMKVLKHNYDNYFNTKITDIMYSGNFQLSLPEIHEENNKNYSSVPYILYPLLFYEQVNIHIQMH